MTDEGGSLHDEGVEALQLMREALQLLDRCEGAGIAAAQLDLAICRLQELVDSQVVDERKVAR